MKRLALAFALSLLAGPALAQFVALVPATSTTAALPTSTQAITKLISGVSGKYTAITGWHIVPASGAVVTWSAGTGTNCGTNTLVLDGPVTYGTTIVADDHGTGAGAVLVAPIGADVCLTVGTGAIAGSVAYGQF
jgi:hypothetical protein